MKNRLPFVSVIVPAYNESENIGSCIDFLKNQDYPSDNFEIIDGQQRTISICQFIQGDFSYKDKYFHNLILIQKSKLDSKNTKTFGTNI